MYTDKSLEKLIHLSDYTTFIVVKYGIFLEMFRPYLLPYT